MSVERWWRRGQVALEAGGDLVGLRALLGECCLSPWETAQERSVGSWEEYDEQGVGRPACWQRKVGSRLVGPSPTPGHWGGQETQSARPHPPGTLSHPGGAGTTSEQQKCAGKTVSSLFTPSLTEERKEEGWGTFSLEKEDRVKGLGARGRAAWCQVHREDDLGFESQKMRSWVRGGGKPPHPLGGKPLNRFCYVWPQ